MDERLKRIREHFANISVEQFEENLIKAGIETIEPSGGEIVSELSE